MPAPYYQLLGHVLLAAQTAEHDESCAAALKASGFNKIHDGVQLAERGEELVHRRLRETVEDKNLDHSVHSALNELEMWSQATVFRMRRNGLDASLLKQAQAHDVHGQRHTATAIAQALRLIGMIRTNQDLQAAIGDTRQVRDQLMRGGSLLSKVYRWTDNLALPTSLAPTNQEVFKDIFRQVNEMERWLSALDQAASKSDDLDVLGKIGWLPPGKGLPAGGASFAVTLHERAQQDAPDPTQATETSGWSVGRQGNRENLGDGWEAPTFHDPLAADRAAQQHHHKDDPHH